MTGPENTNPLEWEAEGQRKTYIEKQLKHTKSPFNLFQLAVQKHTGNPGYLQSRDLWFPTCTVRLAPHSSPAHMAVLQAARGIDTTACVSLRSPSEWPFCHPDSMTGRLSHPHCPCQSAPTDVLFLTPCSWVTDSSDAWPGRQEA